MADAAVPILMGYLCKIKDKAKEPPVAQFYYPDTEGGRAQADKWAKEHDEPGFSVYSCIGRLHSKPRNKDNVAELSCVVTDIDLRAIKETREQVLSTLHDLPIPPDEIHDSGGGLHCIWNLKEPVVDKAGMEQAEAIMRRLARLLAGDPKPTHRAALLRQVGTFNTRYGEPREARECKIIANTGARCDISEFEDLFDIYDDGLLLHYKEENQPLFDKNGKKLPADLETMSYGTTMHDTFHGYLGSAMGKGGTLKDAIEAVVEAASRNPNCQADPRKDFWRHDLTGMAEWWLGKHPEWVDTALCAKDALKWQETTDAGGNPRLVWDKRTGLHARGYEGDKKKATAEEPSPPHKRTNYPCLKSSLQFTSGFTPPDYIIDGVLQRRFEYSLTGKTGDGKTAWGLLLAYCTACGKPMGAHETEQGRVCILAGENPDDVRMRWIAMGEKLGFDHATVAVDFIEGVFPIGLIREVVGKKAAETSSEYALIIVDSSAAYFPGDEENSNTQLGKHARTMRGLTTLPGGPCVVITCHPTKNADPERLLPRGGGAFVAEIDGNLVCIRRESTFEIHWHEKFRGPDFDPMPFRLEEVSTEQLKDSKGRYIPSVMATAMSDEELADHLYKAREDENKILRTLLAWKGKAPSLTELATAHGWVTRLGLPDKSRARRTVDRLIKARLAKREREDLMLTEAGEKAAKKVTP